ncbi:hypothetical protein J32TS6_25500 [Virgibacillus pantothenticus]|uniref:polysaccharide deacetylase family protein n=1 Tax=Virgibacillus pantothenticus TaxID=1473 RepID=UPI001B03ACEF|nr:polysaccharide deacetylase family protein [Virgibacillus pantothenticus]GIP63995.1 hypothetical protein J32TS6_25500 [Virgibacillus pantothenticus]
MKPTKLTYGIIIITGLIAIGLTVSSLFKTIDKEDSTHAKTSRKKEAHPNFSELQVINEKAKDKIYSTEIHYPQFHSEKLNQKMNAYVKTAKRGFLHDVEQNKQQLNHHTATLTIHSDTQKFSDHIYSVAFHEKSCIRKKKCQDSSSAFIVDGKNSKYIDQTDILQDTEQMRDTLFQLLQQVFEQSDKYSEDFSKKKLSQWVYDENNTFSNMYLSDKSAVFKFVNDEVIDKEAEIKIPLSSMQDILTDEWRSMVTGDGKENKKTKSSKKQEERKNVKSASAGEGKHTSSDQKRVALTFDDGPHPENTPKILDLLKQYDAKATFFMQGNQVESNADVAKRVRNEGHEIGNHTWSHKQLTGLGMAGIKQEVEKANQAIRNATGENPTLFRPPYAATNKSIEQAVGLPSILWSVDTRDWESRNPVAILNEVKRSTTDGGILLMHDVHAPTVEGLKLVLEYLAGEGYEFVTVSEIRAR